MSELSINQLAALHEMGIPVWQQRVIVPNDEHNIHQSHAPHNNVSESLSDKPIIFVIPTASSPAEQRLFNNIIQAIGCHSAQYECLPSMPTQAAIMSSTSLRWLIIFGDNQELLDGSHYTHINCPPLTEILHSAQSKSDVWQQLRQLKQFA